VSGVYISYPFCTQKCSFCNFASGVARTDEKSQYSAVLFDEIRAHEWSFSPDTVYFGGGTPSLMPIAELRSLIAAIPARELKEVTLECAPGSFDASTAAAWFDAGVNRVSLGVQSFAKEELKRTGRRHTAEIVLRDVSALRDAGIGNTNIDLIAGLPGQTMTSWRDSLSFIDRIAPEHVSVYIFEVDEDSRLGKEALAGGVRYGARELPDEELTADLYETAVDELARIGVERYEISNFARPGLESLHNLKYWTLTPYVGFGLDAHSFDGVTRTSNPDNLSDYLRRAEPAITASNLTEERIITGLRLSKGIDLTSSEWARYGEAIRKWIHAGMLERFGERIRFTRRGVLVSNEVLQEFIA
jgi:oxygen-independent coproporphyrinogen III oxidase